MEAPRPFPRLLPAGDSCLFVEFGDGVDLAVNGKVQALRRLLLQDPRPGIVELVPTYRSLAVYFDPFAVDASSLSTVLAALAGRAAEAPFVPGKTWRVPVCYGGECGPDLEAVSAHTGLTPAEVIERHTSRDLACLMLGFTPGFPYLGGMDPALQTPRLDRPRLSVAAGSVGIAAAQTGIYPVASPGGWRIIGRTPRVLFDPRRDPPHWINPGDLVRFFAVPRAEFDRLAAER